MSTYTPLDPKKLIRPLVAKLNAYVPGEQPRIPGLIKLNTNENPYPPSPKVLEATRAAVDGRFRLYPSPTADPLRAKLAELHHCTMENIIVGNGSDEILALLTRCFVDPATHKKRESRSTIQFLTPCYSLYPVLAEIHGATINAVPLNPDFTIPNPLPKQWDAHAALTLITTPNAPSGHGYSKAELEAFCQLHQGLIALDEAYVKFAKEDALSLALKYPHVLVCRTFSKAYSLCFQRIGYCIGHPELIAALHKIRDSYNVNGLGQVAATATLSELPYYETRFKEIMATRQRLTVELQKIGFDVPESQTNFLFAKPPKFPAEQWLQKLRDEKVLVRWFKYPEIRDRLRISIGSDAEADALIAVAKKIIG